MKVKHFFATGIIFLGCSQLLLAQDILSTSAIVLPVSPQTSYTVASGSKVNIISTQSITLNPGVTFENGSVVDVMVNSSLVIPPLSNPAADNDKNWVLVKDFDEDGNEVSAAKSFSDNNGHLTQTQIKSEATGHVLASQVLYDVQGRAVANTLSAPINNASFAYKSNFITNSNNPYSYLNFDGDPSSATPYAKLNNPDPIDQSSQGTLGWYYSDNNDLEPVVASTSYPYQRIDFFRDGTDLSKRFAGVDALRMGSGHEGRTVSAPVGNELYNYLLVRNKFFPTSSIGNNPSSMSGQAIQTITTNEDGLKVLTVTDLAGNVLMQGRADSQGGLTVSNTLNMNNVQPQYLFDITLDGPGAIQGNTNDPQIIAMMHASIQGYKINSPYNVTVTCLNCGIATWMGIGDDYAAPIPSPTNSRNFRITSQYPFYISASNSYGAVFDQTPARITEPSKSSTAYFQITTPSAVTVSGNVAIYEMAGETQLTNFASGNTLPAGYYKAIDIDGDASVTFTNKYSDISFNYYNQLGQLIETITPNGVQALISNLADYNTVPFGNSYEYDLQGRMIASTSTDGGKSEYVYRQDGKMRFSQNSLQRVALPERFSYTNYDNLGRPVESGEYIVSNGSTFTFISTKTNATLQENVASDGGLTGGAKQLQVNTYYDSQAANLAATGTGYTQDTGNLKGAISYTTNANSKTWYNYDDHGRVIWTVKQLTGLSGYKTVDYSYDALGNVIKVDFQKGVSAERFIHYYSYDADARLLNVETSRDDISRLQQARYSYYLHGPVKRIELADNLQGIDYTFTPQGWLKSINTPTGDVLKDPGKDGASNSAFAKDAFGMQMEYFPGDYTRSMSGITSIQAGQQTYYNGNVNGISWQSSKPVTTVSAFGTGILDPTMYSYGYDVKNQLSTATWGTPNFTAASFTSSNKYKESVLSYDFNGNIMGMQRTDGVGSLNNDVFGKYTYEPKTNKLLGVANTAGTYSYASYTYDGIGQLASQTKNGSTTYYKYDVTGKIIGIYSDAALTDVLISYSYDEVGNRIKSLSKSGTNYLTTYFVYDSAGNIMAVYAGQAAPVLTEIPVYGGERIGTYYATGNTYYYELRDNVGSVKVVINRTKVSGQADVITFNDYYPFGSIAQNGGTGYRYEYQGAYSVKDPVTGFNNFTSRFYDGKIGRWVTTDPYQQFASPYLGMGNIPVFAIDKDGKWVQILVGAVVGFAIGGGVNIAAQLITGTKLKDINWKSAGVSALQGAATGALASVGVPPVVNIGANAGIGAVADFADQKFAQNKKHVSVGHIIGAAITNGTFAGVSGVLFKNVRINAIRLNVNKNFIERIAVYSPVAAATAFDGLANFTNNLFWDLYGIVTAGQGHTGYPTTEELYGN